MHRLNSYQELLAYLDSLGQFRMKPGLERISAVLKRLGARRPAPLAVQIVGTNGKGSTLAFLQSLGLTAGLRVGSTTSPHFLSPRERIQIDGRMLSEKLWLDLANEVLEASAGLDDELTYFELITAMAGLAFRRQRADLALLETGLGGRYDATTAFDVDLTLFTPIGLDHMAVLGPDIRSIALDKARAMRPGGTAIAGPQPREALAALAETARELGVTLYRAEGLPDLPGLTATAEEPEPRLHFLLSGPHQRANAGLALAGGRWLCRKHAAVCSLEPATEARALSRAWLPGRLQRVPAESSPGDLGGAGDIGNIEAIGELGDVGAAGEAGAGAPASATSSANSGGSAGSGGAGNAAGGWPELLLDGAHNPPGLAALGRALEAARIRPSALIFACLADKDLEAMIPLALALGDGPIFAPELPDMPRALPAAKLAKALGSRAEACESLSRALIRAGQSVPRASGRNVARAPEASVMPLPARNAAPGAAPVLTESVAPSSTGSVAPVLAGNSAPVLVCGSLFLLAEFFRLRPQALIGPHSSREEQP